MLKKILTKSLKFLKMVFLTLISVLGLILVSILIWTIYRSLFWVTDEENFIKNRAKFVEIVNRCNGDKRVVWVEESSGKLTQLNHFSIDYKNGVEIESTGMGLKTRLANLDELYNYYGLKKEEVQWYVEKLKEVNYSSLEKDEMWVASGVNNQIVEFGKRYSDRGIIYNPQNEMLSKRNLERDWKKFERIEKNWFVFIRR
ncbi:MAG: hypothetical protein HY796_06600 [Elusimicrobia bacterium]|nr:hypothetical protein [Elusimicrobiota bacterium]